MKRLKLELKQTMDMYSSACKEAISAKKKGAFFFFFLHQVREGYLNLVLSMGETG